MRKFLKILEKYGSVNQNANQYELTLKITPWFLRIPEEYLDEIPICRQEWKIRITVSENGFEIETADHEMNSLSKDEQKETRELLSKFARGSKIIYDGSRISIKGPHQDNAFKEGIGRIVHIVREYNKLLGHQIIGYTAYYTIDCHCGSRLQYSKFQFRCTNPHCSFAASLKKINDCLDLFLYSDLDCSAITRKGEIAYYLKRTDVKDAYKVVKITDAGRKKWVNHFRKKVDILPLTSPTVIYPEMEFHPLQRGNEETVPTYLCWVDVSGGAKLLRKKDIQNGYSILLVLDMGKRTLQAFKPTRFPRDNVLYLENYDLPIEMPKNVKARVALHEKIVEREKLL